MTHSYGQVFTKLYAVVLAVEAMLGMSYLCTVITWCLLAAFIKPQALHDRHRRRAWPLRG